MARKTWANIYARQAKSEAKAEKWSEINKAKKAAAEKRVRDYKATAKQNLEGTPLPRRSIHKTARTPKQKAASRRNLQKARKKQ